MPRKRLGVGSTEGVEAKGIGKAEVMVLAVCGRNGSRDAKSSSSIQEDDGNAGKVRKVAAADRRRRRSRCC